MGLLDNLLGNFSGLTGGLGNIQKTGQASQMPFTMNLVITDGDAAPIVYNTMAGVLAIIGALAAGSVWTKIWEKTVGAQKAYRWGYGSPATPYNQGYMWFCSMDVTTDFEVGKLRLVQANNPETSVFTVKELDDTGLHLNVVTTLALATPTDMATMKALPEKVEFKKVGEDSKLQLWYRCITAATAEDAVGFSIPATLYQ